MNNPEIIHVLDRTKLRSELYFQSLIEEAHAKGLLSSEETERLQYECLALLAYKAERYNAGNSSSIRAEKAQEIMSSILFTLGLQLKVYSIPEDAVSALKRDRLEDIYKKGRKRINTLLAVTKARHTKLVHELIDTPNYFYRGTLVEGIFGFYKLYSPDFSAHEIHITADYPLYNPISRLDGIEFIREYVFNAYLENQFCSFFSPEDIHHLLCGYANDYKEQLINIYEQTLTAALGCILVGVDCTPLDITQNGADYLHRTFMQQPKSKIRQELSNAAAELCSRFDITGSLAGYIGGSLPMLAKCIELSSKENTRVFYTPAYPENKPKLIFSYGEKMEDEQFRMVIDEITECRHTEDKLAIIKEQVHSFSDLEDVLLEAELTPEEIKGILSGMELTELAALTKKYRPLTENTAYDLREREQLLRGVLREYIEALPAPGRRLIEKTADALEG